MKDRGIEGNRAWHHQGFRTGETLRGQEVLFDFLCLLCPLPEMMFSFFLSGGFLLILQGPAKHYIFCRVTCIASSSSSLLIVLFPHLCRPNCPWAAVVG